MSEKSLEQTLKALHEEYAENLPNVLQTIDKSWQSLQAQWQVETLDELYARVHKLAGSAGSFGFNELSQAARELEIFLQELQRRTTSANELERNNIIEHFNAIHRAAQKRDDNNTLIKETLPKVELLLESVTGKLLYLVDDDADLSNYLALQIRHAGFEVKIFNQVDFLPDAVHQRTPDVLLMDIMLAEDDLAGPRVIYNLQKRRQHPLPVVFMSARVDMKARLAAVRAGGNAYFTKPIDIHALIAKLVELANPLAEENQRVLIIDDNGDYAEDFTAHLHTEQIQVKTLLKPMQLVQTLDKFTPSLIMINQNLPTLTGVELAKIIQQQDKYAQIPLILFSEEFDEHLEQACRQGIVEDYITTQVAPRYLAALVQHRIQKARVCQKLFAVQRHFHENSTSSSPTKKILGNTHQDRLTGLYKRKYLLDQIEIASKHRETEHAPCLLYIKLDNYRDLDRIMGLTATEALVIETAHFLQTQTRSEEVLSRVSDDAFVVLTLNRALNNVRALAELIRTTLENHITEADDGEQILSTCTLGVSLCEEKHAKNPAKALQDAENACALGQEKGGNQVFLHDSIVAEKRGQQQQEYWRQHIDMALKHHTFFLVFQPITNLHGTTRMIYDVLLRLQNPEKGAEEDISPKIFLPLAKETGQLAAIDRWVIKEAIVKLMREYQQRREVTFIVRISEVSLADESLTKWVSDSLRLMPFPRQQLIFDVSKLDVQEHLKQAQHFIKQMQEIGCGVVLSHIDEQANSLQLLRLLTPQFIKLDAQMVKVLTEKPEQAHENIVTLVNEMHQQGKAVIAPFVENMQCLNQLWQYEIDYIAGHFVEAPERELNYDFSSSGDEH